MRLLEPFRSRRVAVMLPLGFAAGLPNPVTGSTLAAWLATEGLTPAAIGAFALVSLPYNFKFVWAPLLDRFAVPWLGRRRGWMALAQLTLLGAIAGMGWIAPSTSLGLLAMAALAVAFLSATQDIVSDAYRTDLLPEQERASGTAVFVAGYRVALLAAGGGALILSDRLAWREVYALLGGLMALGVVATWLAPRPETVAERPASLRDATIAPLTEFFHRRGAWLALAVVLFYKVGDAVASHLLVPFLIEHGFSRTEIGSVVKFLGLGATVVGALAGGVWVARWGLKRSLLVFGALQALANVFYAALAVTGKSMPLLVVSIGLDNLFNGLGTAAFVALLMSLCDKRYTAFQYALLSSAMSVTGKALASGGGLIAQTAGWPTFFLLTVALAVPALVLIPRLPQLDSASPGEASPKRASQSG